MTPEYIVVVSNLVDEVTHHEDEFEIALALPAICRYEAILLQSVPVESRGNDFANGKN